MDYKNNNGELVINLSGRVDSANSAAVESEISGIRASVSHTSVVLDCEKLEYISSAGLRIILRLKKDCPSLKLINVSSEVYEIFDMTGFTEIADIQKAYRVVSVDGCEVIGEGANGKVYRIDPDTIVKVYKNPDSLDEIKRERELARLAFVSGIPTAIPYDVVRVEGGGYGSVFELLSAKSFAKLIISGEKTVDEIAEMSVELLKSIHATVVDPGSMPEMRDKGLKWVGYLDGFLPAETFAKLRSLFENIKENNHMIHGDFHIKNIMLQNGEVLLIDMDTLSHGHPVFEFSSIYNAYIGFGSYDTSRTENFLGVSRADTERLWQKTLELYFGNDDSAKLAEIEEKIKLLSFTRLLRYSAKRKDYDKPETKEEYEMYRNTVIELTEKIDSLEF